VPREQVASVAPHRPPGFFVPPGLSAPLMQPLFAPPPGLVRQPAYFLDKRLSGSAALVIDVQGLDDCSQSMHSGSSETASTVDPGDAEPLFPDSPQTVIAPPAVPTMTDMFSASGFLCLACPSVGSREHHLGTCRPCDFAGRGIECRDGADCKFCHLCGPAERRQLRNQRRKQLRALIRVTGAASKEA